MSISPKTGARGSKDCHLLKYCNVQNSEVDSLWACTLLKIGIQITLGGGGGNLLMFSKVFQELSERPSVVNSFKVTNWCKNGIHICEIWRDA